MLFDYIIVKNDLIISTVMERIKIIPPLAKLKETRIKT